MYKSATKVANFFQTIMYLFAVDFIYQEAWHTASVFQSFHHDTQNKV